MHDVIINGMFLMLTKQGDLWQNCDNAITVIITCKYPAVIVYN